MPDRPKPLLGTWQRRAVSLLTALSFLVVAVSGVLAFVQPFSLGVIGLHALMGFVFIVLIGLHVVNNRHPLASYLRSRTLWAMLAVAATLTVLFGWQPAPVKTVLGWSGNLGPALERFEMREDAMVFEYAPSPQYHMRLSVQAGPSYQASQPPQIAIWLENQGGYHIKTLLAPQAAAETPYWSFKHAGWEKARREAEAAGPIDAVTSPTPNGSFDPADYILPPDQGEPTPYSLLVEINQAGDGQPSLVHAVTIDNTEPRTYQVLELRGYPKRAADAADGRQVWDLHYVDESFTTALDLIDSALLTLQRAKMLP